MVLDNLLAEARAARLADNYEAAIALCNAYLTAHPGDPEAESLLGLCEIETNRKSGAARIEGAAARKPESHSILLNLSILREAQGDVRAAIQLASTAAQKAPKTFECWAQLGKLLGKAEKFDEALAALEQARKIQPVHKGVLTLLSAAALECGDFEKCESALRELERQSTPRETVQMRAHLERKRGNWRALQDRASEWLELDHSNEEARLALAHALAQQGFYDQAATVYSPLCATKTPAARHLAAMGRYKLGGRRLGEAKSWFEKALSTDPRCAEAAYGMARLSHFLGNAKAAEDWCRKALRIEPGHADAFSLLADAGLTPPGEEDIAAIDRALSAPRLREAEKISLLFAKGDFLHAMKRADEAFDAWSEANEIKTKSAAAAGVAYDPSAHERFVWQLIELFPQEDATTSKVGKGDATPIFIVGMPRSGTTLLETALSAHADVDAAGEVPAMPFILQEFVGWALDAGWRGGAVPEEKRNEWRGLYLSQCARFGAKGARFFTDKQPSNFLSVGLIAKLFPDARIIYLRRNPVETSFSIFRRNFTRQWAFTSRLENIAHYYAEHCRIAEHWRKAFADRVMFVQYEEFVRNFEAALRDIVAFCGLPWDGACLNYHEQGRPVITFSASQVRKPPSEKHLSSTAPYAHRLGALTEKLVSLGVDLETGARRTD